MPLFPPSKMFFSDVTFDVVYVCVRIHNFSHRLKSEGMAQGGTKFDGTSLRLEATGSTHTSGSALRTLTWMGLRPD